MLFFAALAGTAAPSANLLFNGDFHQAGTDGRPLGWRAAGNAACVVEGATMEVGYDPERLFESGSRAVKVTRYCPPGGKSSFDLASDPLPVKHGQTYQVSLWLRSDEPIHISFFLDGDSGELARQLGQDYLHWWSRPEGQARLGPGWQEYRLEAKVPGPDDADYLPELRTVRLKIQPANGTLWLGRAAVEAVVPPPPPAAPKGDFYTFEPDDQVGDIHVLVDDMRFLRGAWREINLFRQWGECATPLTYRFSQVKPVPLTYLPAHLTNPITARLAPDLAVKVVQTASGVDYQWVFACAQGDYTPLDVHDQTLPSPRTPAHQQSDLEQVNRVRVSSNRISLSSTLTFLRPPAGPIFFHPALFPGYGGSRKYQPERRILGCQCTVLNQRGETRSVNYPAEQKPQLWLDDEPRSLLFDLGEAGQVRFNFSFSDPAISLRFYACTGRPTTTLTPYTCPAIVGELMIPARTAFTHGSYQCTLQMEAVVAPAATPSPRSNALTLPRPPTLSRSNAPTLQRSDPLTLRWLPAARSGRFFTTDPLSFQGIVEGLPSKAPRSLHVGVRVLDYDNRAVHRQRLRLSLPRDHRRPMALTLPALGQGAYVLASELREGGALLAARADRFCVLDRPVACPAAQSFFGCESGFMRFPAKDLGNTTSATALLHDLGIKRLRWAEHWTVDWGLVEKDPGKFQFPQRFDRLQAARSLGMETFLEAATFEGPGEFTPPWAKSGRTTLYGYDIPKDLQAYEDYCYEVARRFRGLTAAFETENEPNLRGPMDQRMQDYIATKAAVLSAAYRGIKRAQPGALVVGGTVDAERLEDLDWLERLLRCAAEKNWKLYDVMAPHYLLGLYGRPEDNLERLFLASRLAARYGLRLWNGENNYAERAFYNTYPNFTFLPEEKEHASRAVRQYLLHKAFGVEHLSACDACSTYNPPRGLLFFEYESIVAGNFFGRGGFIKPHAVAHAVLARLTDGATSQGRLELGQPDSWAVAFKRGDETTAAVWLRLGEAALDLDLPAGTRWTNLVGRTRTVSGRQRFTVSEEPFYLTASGRAGFRIVEALTKGHWTHPPTWQP